MAYEQRQLALLRHPSPLQLTDVIRRPHRLWERRQSDEDFMVLRLGVGTGEFARGVEVKPTNNPMSVAEPIAQAHLDRMMRRCQSIEELPIAIPAIGVVSLIGSPTWTTNAVRAMLLQATALHSPDDLRIHLALPLADDHDNGRWSLWLPHLLDEDRFDGPIGRRGVSTNPSELTGLYEELQVRREEIKEKGRHRPTPVERHHLIIVVDSEQQHGHDVAELLADLNLTIARVTLISTATDQTREPAMVDVRVSINASGGFVTEFNERGAVKEPEDGKEGYPRRALTGGHQGQLDQVSPTLAEAVARELSPLRLVEDATPDAPLEKTITLDRMLGISDFGTYDIAEMWQPRSREDFLNVPFGIDADGNSVHLDIKESAKNGMGPHGLCVGATGSGKSEVLRTIVLAQAICHPPEDLSLVLVDFKGGATFAGLEPLPHTAAIVDNLEDATGLVDRLHDSILGEIQRRQRVLQGAGNLANVAEYNALRAEGKVKEPLPVLFVVIDEFGELLAAKPEFIELFVQIGRIGRSIGMHLLLASQRLEEGRLRGLESYLSYRLGLRTFSAQESRTAIGTKDAHELPPIPGSGLLKVDPDIFDRFKAAYVSGPYVPAGDKDARELPPVPMPLDLHNTTEEWLEQRREHHRMTVTARELSQRSGEDETVQITLDKVVSRLTPAATRTRQIWLPPLPEHLTLEGVTGKAKLTSDRGLSAPNQGHLRIPLGIQDRPLEQWQGPLLVDLSGSGGNMAILGAPQSGKSTVLRTLVTSAALTHTPKEVNFYAVDVVGSSLKSLSALPHVGGVATRFEAEELTRMIAEVEQWLGEREQLFSSYHIDNVAQMREMHRAGELTELPAADIVLIIDGWATFRKDFGKLAEQVQDIAQRGLGYGVHVIFAAGRWADFRLQLQAVIGTKVELHINDPIDSTIGRKYMIGMDGAPTGRVLTEDTYYSQVSLPVLQQPDVVREPTSEALIQAIAGAWTGVSAPGVRMLPEQVSYTEIRREDPGTPPAMVGLAEANLRPVRFDLDGAQRHLLIIGDSQMGKTSTLKTLITEVLRDAKPNEVMFGVYDMRRSLLGFVPQDFLGDYAGTRQAAETLTKGICMELERRLPPANVTVEQLRNRSWWSGPEIYIVIDDYDMIEGNANPLKPFIPYLPQAANIGLHVIAARRSAGAGRMGYEAFIQAMKEAGANGVLLSGEKQEGQIFPGTFLRPLPPGRANWVDRAGRQRLLQLALYDIGW